MSRFIGGIFGNTLPAAPSTTGASSGVYTINDQNYLAAENAWNAKITATGGQTYTPGDGYKYHIFTGNGTFGCSEGSGTAETLVVGGGGAGGRQHGGGGGGGSIVHWTGWSVTAQNYSIEIGGAGTVTWPGSGDVPGNPNTATSGGKRKIIDASSTLLVQPGGVGGGATWFATGPTANGGGSGGGSNNGGTGSNAIMPGAAPPTSPASNPTGAAGGCRYQKNGGQGSPHGGGGGGAGAVG